MLSATQPGTPARKRIATTRREAERLRRGLLADLEAGRIDVDDSITVTDWCETWLAGAARLTCKERTVAGYKYALDRWVLPHVGRPPVVKTED